MKAEFIARVMQIMNELEWDNIEADAFIGSDDTKLEGNIEGVFVDAWRKAVNILPKIYFEVKDFSENDLIPFIHNGSGYVFLPDNFYTLFRFRMYGWQKAVEKMYDVSDAMASVQANEYTRGNIARPVCIRDFMVDANKNVRMALKYYSLPLGHKHEAAEALYIPNIGTLTDETVIGDNLFVPLAYLCASQVYNIFEKYDIAKLLEAKVIEIIN